MNYIYTRSSPFCPWCERVKALLDGYGIPYEVMDITIDEDAQLNFTDMGWKSVPQVLLNNKYIGGFEATAKYLRSGEGTDLRSSDTHEVKVERKDC